MAAKKKKLPPRTATKDRKGLTASQQRLLNEMLSDPKATIKQCAGRAGISYDYARRTSTNRQFIAALHLARNKAARDAGIDAQWVLKEQVKVYNRCMTNEAVLNTDGKEIGVYKFDAAGANRALENIGKHVNVNAFKGTDESGNPIDHNWVLTIVDAKSDPAKKT